MAAIHAIQLIRVCFRKNNHVQNPPAAAPPPRHKKKPSNIAKIHTPDDVASKYAERKLDQKKFTIPNPAILSRTIRKKSDSHLCIILFHPPNWIVFKKFRHTWYLIIRIIPDPDGVQRFPINCLRWNNVSKTSSIPPW